MNNNLNLLDKKYEKVVLDNGLEVILYEDKSLPLVSVNLWYRVGSSCETPGKTGFAHLFEHMMFQGSLNVEKEMHFRYIQEAGGSLNGSTSIDRTNYYETLPSNNLDLALWLESDRMGFMLDGLIQEKLDNQKSVVMNERRQRYENEPYGLAWELLFSNLFEQDFPYHWPTIGWMKDIENFELDDIKDFFRKYYSPNNASLVIAGDMETKDAIKSVEKYFSEIPSEQAVSPLHYNQPALTESKHIVHEDNVQLPRIYLAWISDKVFSKDDPDLDALSDILGSSKNSRLYKSLVHEKQIAQDVSCFQYSANLTGMFIIVATAKPGVELDTIKSEIMTEIEKLAQEGVTENELLRTLNGIKSSFLYSLQNVERMANQFNSYNFYLNEPNSFIIDLERYERITAQTIADTAKKHLFNNHVRLDVVPKSKNTI